MQLTCSPTLPYLFQRQKETQHQLAISSTFNNGLLVCYTVTGVEHVRTYIRNCYQIYGQNIKQASSTKYLGTYESRNRMEPIRVRTYLETACFLF